MTKFSTLLKNFTVLFEISFKSQLHKISASPLGKKCTDIPFCHKNHASHLKISRRNYNTGLSLLQGQRFPKRSPTKRTVGPPPGSFKSSKVIWFAGGTGCILIYYLTHLKESPITKRKRFIVFDNETVSKMSFKVNEKMLNRYEPDMLSPGHPKYKKVTNVVNRLLGANEDVIHITKIPWKLSVVNKPTVNAFVLVDGHIVVFTGMVDFCRNDDQLGAVLGHELSHVILEHIPEKISNAQLLNMIIIIPVLLVSTVLPLVNLFLLESLMSHLAQLAVSLPFSRKLETEADEVGILLAARACFDVREASKLWERMDKVTKGQPPGFLSTHPSHESRKKRLESLAGLAMDLRSRSGCPPLDGS